MELKIIRSLLILSFFFLIFILYPAESKCVPRHPPEQADSQNQAPKIQPPSSSASRSQSAPVKKPPKEASVPSQPKAATVPSPPKEASVPSPPKAASVPSPPKAASVPSPPKAASVPSPPKEASVPSPPKEASVPSPPKAAPVPSPPKAAPVPPTPQTASVPSPPKAAPVPPTPNTAPATPTQNTAPATAKAKGPRSAADSLFSASLMANAGAGVDNSVLDVKIPKGPKRGKPGRMGSSYDSLKKVCKQTDYSELCLSSLSPFYDGKSDATSLLVGSLKAATNVAKSSATAAEDLAKAPTTNPFVASKLKDCYDSLSDALDNLVEAASALDVKDYGKLNSMLSAVISDAMDCEEKFPGANSPMQNNPAKLQQMASNSLAIASLAN